MDSAVNVPRWTPSPSPTRSLLQEPETKANVVLGVSKKTEKLIKPRKPEKKP